MVVDLLIDCARTKGVIADFARVHRNGARLANDNKMRKWLDEVFGQKAKPGQNSGPHAF